MSIEIDAVLAGRISEVIPVMISENLAVAEIPQTDGMVLVLEGTPEADKRKAIGQQIKAFPIGTQNFILCHK